MSAGIPTPIQWSTPKAFAALVVAISRHKETPASLVSWRSWHTKVPIFKTSPSPVNVNKFCTLFVA
jgi:hypothetical protein